MPLDLLDFERLSREAVRAFWTGRLNAHQRQIEKGRPDAGSRGAVTAGKNMDGFRSICLDIVRANGLPGADFWVSGTKLNIPGFFRPTKSWDLLIFHQSTLVAALEFKSQVGSFSNNANNRAEEVVGTATDLWTAYREGAFGKNAPRPFVGWLMLLEDHAKSRRPMQREMSPHFPIFPEFRGNTYVGRYQILCEKLVRENLYTATALISSQAEAGAATGAYVEEDASTCLRQFFAGLAGHAAALAA